MLKEKQIHMFHQPCPSEKGRNLHHKCRFAVWRGTGFLQLQYRKFHHDRNRQQLLRIQEN
jgi:hypothetical protein